MRLWAATSSRPQQRLQPGEIRFFDVCVVVCPFFHIVDVSFIAPPLPGSGVLSVIFSVVENFPSSIIKTYRVYNNRLINCVDDHIPLDGVLYRIILPPNVFLDDVGQAIYYGMALLGCRVSLMYSDRLVGLTLSDDEYAIY